MTLDNKIINFDINRNNIFNLTAKQFDTTGARSFTFRLLKDSIPFDLEGLSVKVGGKKPDGKDILNDCTIINCKKGIVEVRLTTQMQVVAGTLNLELIMFKGETRLSTIPFEVQIIQSATCYSKVQSSDEFGTLQNAINTSNEYADKLKEGTEKLELQYANKLNELSDDTSQLNSGRFKQKKYVAVGDSITVGFVDKPYATIVGETMDLNVVNMGVSGSAVTVTSDRDDSIYKRRSEIPEDADIISIFGGTNDFGHNSPMGIYDNKDSGGFFYNFYGAYYNLIKWIQENRPKAQLFVITPLHRETGLTPNQEGYILEDYVNVIRDVANEFSVPVLDFYADGSFNPAISQQKNIFTADGLHPKQIGHYMMAHKIVNFIRGL